MTNPPVLNPLNPSRIQKARLAANMSRADLAYRIRTLTQGRIKATERQVRGWEKGEYAPRDGSVVNAIAAATGKDAAFFYEQDGDEDDDEAELLRDLQSLPADLRLRVERALRRARSEA